MCSPIEPRRIVVDLAGAGAVRLQIDQPGRLDALTVHAVKRIPPAGRPGRGPGRGRGAQLQRRAQGHGRVPGLDGNAPVIGGECVGYVTARGANVDSVEIGQRVIAFGPGAFGSHLTTLADLVVAVPDALAGSRGGHVRRRVSDRVACTVRGRAAGARRTRAHPFRHRRRRTGGGCPSPR